MNSKIGSLQVIGTGELAARLDGGCRLAMFCDQFLRGAYRKRCIILSQRFFPCAAPAMTSLGASAFLGDMTSSMVVRLEYSAKLLCGALRKRSLILMECFPSPWPRLLLES